MEGLVWDPELGHLSFLMSPSLLPYSYGPPDSPKALQFLMLMNLFSEL